MTRVDYERVKGQWNDLTEAEKVFMIVARNPISKCPNCKRPGTEFIMRRRDRKPQVFYNHASAPDGKRRMCLVGRLVEDLDKRLEEHDQKVNHRAVVEDILAVLEKHGLLPRRVAKEVKQTMQEESGQPPGWSDGVPFRRGGAQEATARQ